MTRVIESMTQAEHSGSMKQNARIFSPRGRHLLAMYARTANAAAFRRWVLDVLEGYAPAPVAAADRVLTEPAYRLEAQQFAQNTMTQYRALLPAGTPVPAWDAAAEQRLADGLIAAVLGANRRFVSVDHTQRLQATPVPRHAAIIDPKNAENMVRRGALGAAGPEGRHLEPTRAGRDEALAACTAHSALLRASAMRVCQPGPVAFQRSSVSRGRRSVVETFVGVLFGPRRRTVPTCRPACFITAPSQSAAVVRGLSASWAMS